jgi:Type I phosphodiesterase / nucleotide pyrophosphatase
MRHLLIGLGVLAFLAAAVLPAVGDGAPKRQTENVLFVMTDGLRWQEVFSGADEALLNKERGGVADVKALKDSFWRETAEERRAALMPFVWSEIAKKGQLFGNRKRNSTARVTNGLNFSYPGYSELFCGFVDPRINSNDKRNNPNVTVFEWLNQKPAYHGRIAAITTWDVFPYIINRERSGIPVNACHEPLADVPETPAVKELNAKITGKHFAKSERLDALTIQAAVEYAKAKKPRVLYVSLDQTDAFGHAGRYDRLLHATRDADNGVKQLWELMQAMPEYRGKTTLIFCPDHGRGDAPVEWKNHGKRTTGSEFTWLAVLGPDTPALGERHDTETIGWNQIAATLAALLGEDYVAATPKAGKPIADVLPAPTK